MITAKEARTLANKNNGTQDSLNDIYGQIMEAAREGKGQVIINGSLRKEVEMHLTFHGYAIYKYEEEKINRITW